MSNRKIKLKLSPREVDDLKAIAEETGKTLSDLVKKIVREKLKQDTSQHGSGEVDEGETFRDQQLEGKVALATKARLDAKHEVVTVGSGLEEFLHSQPVESKPTNVSQELKRRRHSEEGQSVVRRLTRSIEAPIKRGCKFVSRIGNELLEPASDGSKGE